MVLRSCSDHILYGIVYNTWNEKWVLFFLKKSLALDVEESAVMYNKKVTYCKSFYISNSYFFSRFITSWRSEPIRKKATLMSSIMSYLDTIICLLRTRRNSKKVRLGDKLVKLKDTRIEGKPTSLHVKTHYLLQNLLEGIFTFVLIYPL